MLRAIQATALALLCAAALAGQELRPRFTPLGSVLPFDVAEAVESPSGRYLLAIFFDSANGEGLARYDRKSGQWTMHPGNDLGTGLTFSPDGRFLAYQRPAQGQPGSRYVWVTPIDSVTNLPNGPTRRVTRRPGTGAEFSPDSRLLVFRSSDSSTSWIVTVPATGGEEKVLLERPGRLGPPHWSPDGRFVYAAYARVAQPTFVLRIPTSGGRTDTVTGPFPSGGNAVASTRAFVGVSADGRHLLESPAHFRDAVLADSSGRTIGQFALPSGLAINHWSRLRPELILGVQRRTPTSLQTVSVVDGAIRTIDTGRRFDQNPAWSPDGSRIAFATQVGAVYQVVVSAPDGRGQRILASRSTADGPLAWSPDGRLIAYATFNPAVLSVIDVRTGALRLQFAVDTTRDWKGTFVWRRDSQGLIYLREPSLPNAPSRDREVRSVLLGGQDRLLRALPEAMLPPSERVMRFVSDSLLAVARQDSLVGIPLPAGPVRTLYRGPVINRWIEGSRDGHWIGFATYAPSGSTNRTAMVISVLTGEVLVPAPSPGLLTDAVYPHPDGKHLVVFGHTADVQLQISLVSLNREPPRVLTAGRRIQMQTNSFSLSPDGRTILFNAYRTPETQLMEIVLPPERNRPVTGRPVRRP